MLNDLLVGRHPADLRFLDQRLRLRGTSLAAIVPTLTSNPAHLSALRICAEMTRPDSTVPVDQHLVGQDLENIITLLKLTPVPVQRLFDMVLRRSDLHLAQLNLCYRLKMGKELDEDIRLNMGITDGMARKVLVHAIRTASNMVYRDVMCLRDAFGSFSGSNERLAIRITRLHWQRNYWRHVQGQFMGIVQKRLIEKVNGKSGLLRDVLAAMCEVERV